jgi:hypothetical protein
VKAVGDRAALDGACIAAALALVWAQQRPKTDGQDMSRAATGAILAFMLAVAGAAAAGVAAQESRDTQFSALARVDPAGTLLTDTGDGLKLDLALSQGVPWRAYTLTAPPRLVMDFREVDWTGLDEAVMLNADNAQAVRFGGFRPGWSRMVVDLAGPMVIDSVVMNIAPETGKARLRARLRRAGAQEFAERSGAPHDPRWDLPRPSARAGQPVTFGWRRRDKRSALSRRSHITSARVATACALPALASFTCASVRRTWPICARPCAIIPTIRRPCRTPFAPPSHASRRATISTIRARPWMARCPAT